MIRSTFSHIAPYNKIINTQNQFDNLIIEQNDSIKLNDVFNGVLTIDQDSVSITNGGIDGSEILTGFIDEGSGIYSLDTSEPLWLYIDGVDAKLSQYDTALTINSVPSNNQIQISALSGVDVTGAKLIFKPAKWVFSREYIINSNSSGTLTLNKDTNNDGYPPENGDSVYIYNKLDFIQNDYDWCYESGILYVKLPSSPANFTIRAVRQNKGITVNADNFTLNNSTVRHFFESGLDLSNANDNLSIVYNNIYNCREDGIRGLSNNTNLDINYNNIYSCGASGMLLGNCEVFNVNYNTIYNIGTGSNYGWVKDSQSDNNRNNNYGAAVFVSVNTLQLTGPYANNFLIERNLVYNTAYSGIHTGAGYDGLITKNIIHDTMQVLGDGGGIYTFFYRNAYPLLGTGLEISYNFIYNSDNAESVIYLDNRTQGAYVHHNTIYSCQTRAIMSNADTSLNRIENNTIYDAYGIWYRDWNAPSKVLDNDDNINRYNIIVCKNPLQYCLETDDSVAPFSNGGTLSNNYYVSPYETNIASLNSATNINNSDFATVQSVLGDVNSTALVNYIEFHQDPKNEIRLITNPTDEALTGTAPVGTWKDVDENVVTSYNVPAWSSLIILKYLP